jgi:hypothetical protein
MIECFKRLDRGLVHVPIKSQYCKLLNRCRRQSVLEPSFDENDPLIQKPILPKILFDNLSGNGELPVHVVNIIGISVVGFGTRGRQPLEAEHCRVS